MIQIRIGRLAVMALLSLGALDAQSTATLRGVVTDPSGAQVAGARVTLTCALTGFQRELRTGEDGAFLLANLPLQTYELAVEKEGFAVERRSAALRSNIPVSLEIRLALAVEASRITVAAFESATLVDVEATGTRTALNLGSIERMPIGVGTRGLEAVLVSFPGFAQNANGAIHPRGAHNQMTYVIDGMPISDQLTGSFAGSLDPSIVQTIELFTGNIPVEFGNKVSGVAAITARSGMGAGRKFGGSSQTAAAGFDTLSNITQFLGGTERAGYFASFSTLRTHRFLDQVTLDNLHNGGNAERAFVKLDGQATPRDWLRMNLMAGRSSFELANLRSQQAAGQDQRQLLRDFSVSLGWVHTLSPRATWDSTISYRTSIAQLLPSDGDRPVTAAQARHLSTLTVANRWNRVQGRHILRAGVDFQHFPVSENFSFGITDLAFNDPLSEGYQPTLRPHDLSRGGRLFHFSQRQAGDFLSGFLQDNFRAGRWALSLGLRYDDYRFLVEGHQLQPRVGVSYHLRETGTVLRASYNRTYQTPPNENLLLSNSPQAAVLAPPAVREALGGAVIRIQPERQDFYEAGVQQGLGGRASLNAAYYHKESRDQQDNDNFFNTGIIFPTSLARQRVNGVEMRLNLIPVHGFSGALSLTHSHAITTPPFTGGLFLSKGAIDVLAAGPFVIDHDQALGMHGNVQYAFRRNWWVSSAVRHDSGLVSNPSDAAVVAADPDYRDLLPYVNLAGRPPRVHPRTIADVALGYERMVDGRPRWDAQVHVTNLTGRAALYNFQSVFVGTRVVAPRTVGVKMRWHF